MARSLSNAKPANAKPSPVKKSRRSPRPLAPARIIELLDAEYGTVPWRPNGEPVAELVLTLLSQNTSDSNSGRAFIRLLNAFPDWPSLLDADVKAIERAIQPAVAQGTVDVCLTAPEPGTYAVAVYHDENANVKFDKNWFGLPVEGYGISNNPTFFLRAPAFDEAKFEALVGPTIVPVEVRY